MKEILTEYKTFCQLKELVTRQTPILIAGIDVAKNRHTGCIRVGG